LRFLSLYSGKLSFLFIFLTLRNLEILKFDLYGEQITFARKEQRSGRRKKIALILPPHSFVSGVLPFLNMILVSGGWYNNNNNFSHI
jgi:hypothetical protein